MKQRTWADWEKQPPQALLYLRRLAETFGVSTDYLLGLTDDPDPVRAENRAQEAALDTASNEEPGPYPLWSRSPLALRLDFWRWLYWRAAVTRRPLDVIIAEVNAIPDTADGWRRNLLKHFDDTRLHAWEPPSAPPETFEIEAVVAALKRSVRN